MLSCERVDLWGRPRAVYRAGRGTPLVWLHGLYGVEAETAFIEALAERHEVIAPLAPGFADLAELDDLRDVHDLALHYDDLLEALGLPSVRLVGHSFGAMIAAEVAAHVPRRVEHLDLISPLGLWNDDYPVADLFAVPAPEMPRLLYRHPPPPTDDGADVESLVSLARGMATVARFLWPIPDRGLARRLRRVRAPTLVVHGESDAFVPVRYAADFAAALPSASTYIVQDGSHMLPAEFPQHVLAALNEEVTA